MSMQSTVQFEPYQRDGLLRFLGWGWDQPQPDKGIRITGMQRPLPIADLMTFEDLAQLDAFVIAHTYDALSSATRR